MKSNFLFFVIFVGREAQNGHSNIQQGINKRGAGGRVQRLEAAAQQVSDPTLPQNFFFFLSLLFGQLGMIQKGTCCFPDWTDRRPPLHKSVIGPDSSPSSFLLLHRSDFFFASATQPKKSFH